MGKRYLVRSGYDPLKIYSVEDVLFNNITGCNTGNMLYSYGVFNILKTAHNTIASNYYKTNYSEAEIEFINENFDAFILPLADAFRVDWEKNLIAYTELIRKLKIPCVVVGCGLRAPYSGDLSSAFPFDNQVKEFVKAVLEKSSIIGLRGWRTGEYLKRLGFREEIDYTAIGCPSLYTYGNSIKTKEASGISRLLINISPNTPEAVGKFLLDSCHSVKEYTMILQDIEELFSLYYGRKNKKWKLKTFPYNMVKLQEKKKCVNYFYDPKQWYDYLEQYDFSLGTRFHGTVAAILAGLPYIVIPIDSRMQELVEYHQLTHLDLSKVKGDFFEYVARLDFKSFEKNQQKNLNHYKDFLKKNEIETVFDYDIDISKGNSPLEKIRKPSDHIILPYEACAYKEKMRRIKQIGVKKIRSFL